MIHHYTVIGNPVEHSLSPRIHALFAEQTQRSLTYTRTLATSENLRQTVTEFFATGGNGCNVTVPFKEQILGLCDELSESAQLAGAVNTIVRAPDNTLCGHNTDGSGLLCDLTSNLGLSLSGKRVLITGAGGSVRGILGPLLQAGPSIVIANRTVSRADELAKRYRELGPVSASGYDELEGRFDLIINATSLSLQGKHPPLSDQCVDAQTVAYDLMYGRQSAFMQWAANAGAGTVHDGLGMLLEQAADAFFLWEGVRPKTRMVLPKL